MIAVIQNSEKEIKLLAAQRQLYATAKCIFKWQAFIGGPIAILTAIILFFYPEFMVYIAFWGLVVVLSNLFWLTPWQKRVICRAAKIQEAFDCDVLQLPWNDLKADKYTEPELINVQFNKYMKWANQMPSLKNWYSPRVDELPIYIGRVICQRSNCHWDASQRRYYAKWLISIVTVIIIFVFVLSLYNEVSMKAFLLKGIIPILPTLLIGFRQFNEQTDAAKRLDTLKNYYDKIWKAVLSREPESVITNMSRNLQDEILENRQKTSPVWDFIFKRLRNDYEINMNHTVDYYVDEAKLIFKN